MIVEFGEVFQSIRQHKRRNVITGFGVAWGIFILILLQGSGNGLENGVSQGFSSFSTNTIFVWSGRTSISTFQRNKGEFIFFDEPFLQQLKKQNPSILHVAQSIRYSGNSTTSYQQKEEEATVKGIGKDFFLIKNLKLDFGRHFNTTDHLQNKAVCIIGEKLHKTLKQEKESNLIGKNINVAGKWLKVVGILKKSNSLNQDEGKTIFVPYSTYKSLFGRYKIFTFFSLAFAKDENPKQFESKLKIMISKLLHFDPKDERAIYIYNLAEEKGVFDSIFLGIKIFLWFVGISILLSGIVGVANIMLVVVKERTREIGIRKALGATSTSILLIIILESILITLISGIFGILLGIGFLKIINFALNNFTTESFIIKNTEVDFGIIIGALILLIISGTFAGLFPARKAAKIVPVKALNEE